MSRFKDATSATLIAPLEPFARRCRLACKLLMPHYKGPSSTAFSSQSAKVNDFFILSQKGRRRPWRQAGGVFIAPISQSASSRAWRISGHGRRKREREREKDPLPAATFHAPSLVHLTADRIISIGACGKRDSSGGDRHRSTQMSL
jgi:hypothetical protein